jgi:hypothetical protein
MPTLRVSIRIPSHVPEVGKFNRSPIGNSCQAPKIQTLSRDLSNVGDALLESYKDPSRALDPRKVQAFVKMMKAGVQARHAAILAFGASLHYVPNRDFTVMLSKTVLLSQTPTITGAAARIDSTLSSGFWISGSG